MANPTTNYGWPMPTSTDLVTDLPADFALFGQPVDTSLKALNPETTLGDIAYRSSTSNTNTRLGIGTSGQVLAVSGGGVPAWTTTADVTPLTTKGDVFTFSTVDARIGVGANNTVLTADSAEATGLKWATPASGGMTLLQTMSCTTASTTSSTISGSYKMLRIFLEGAQLNGEQIQLRFNGDSTGLYGVAGTNTANITLTDTAITISGQNVGNVATNLQYIEIPDYTITTTGKICSMYGFSSNNGGSFMIIQSIGAYRSNTAITSLTIKASTGASITATALIYGVN